MRPECSVSVSPLYLCPITVADAGLANDDDYIDLKKTAALGEPSVGVESITLGHRGTGALAARPLPSHKEPTQAEIDRRTLTHLPYEPWCPMSIACRRINDHHRLQRASNRNVPLLVGDCCFARNTGTLL